MSNQEGNRLLRPVSDTNPPNGKINLVVDAQRFRIGLLEAKEILEDLSGAVKEAERVSACNSLPRWQCHKVVEAVRIGRIDESLCRLYCLDEEGALFPVFLSCDYFKKHNPQPGGYYVRYEDGYESYSPAEALEKGYTRINALCEMPYCSRKPIGKLTIADSSGTKELQLCEECKDLLLNGCNVADMTHPAEAFEGGCTRIPEDKWEGGVQEAIDADAARAEARLRAYTPQGGSDIATGKRKHIEPLPEFRLGEIVAPRFQEKVNELIAVVNEIMSVAFEKTGMGWGADYHG